MTHKAAWALGLCCALPALAQQSANDLEMLKKYAGTWAVDCAKPGVRLGVDVKALTLAGGGKRFSSSAPPMAAFSWFGQQQPPAGFEAALLGEGRGTSLTFLAMKDASGPYLTVDSDPLLQKQFGQAALAGKFRRCP
ncbi:MAG: hypothetical protein J0L57_02685 [Burkholderiales bacterium]|nr:hypothetical protein [Burkholderiales bacterium]